MKYDLTFKQFLQNPTGPYSAYFGKRAEIIANLEKRFTNLIATRSKDFDCKPYKDENDYYFLITIPSETFKTMKYQVVVQLSPLNEGAITDSTINNYECKFFSNSPAFVYTYAYVFNENGHLINFLTSKFDKKILMLEPEIKNPVHIYGYEKSLYFAMLYIKYKRYNIKSSIPNKPFNKEEILKNVEYCNDIQIEYDKLKRIEANKKRAEKEKEKKRKALEKQKEMIAKNNQRKNAKKNKVIKPKKKI